MAVIINSNYAASLAALNLAETNKQLQRSLTRLSSFQKITTGADDPGGLAVSMKLTAAATRSGAVATVIANATSLLQSQDGSLKSAYTALDRISELKTLYADPTKTSADLALYDTEFLSLQDTLQSLASETFNGLALFGSSASFVVPVTEDGSTTSAITLAARDISSTSTGYGVVSSGSITSLASLSLAQITAAIENIATLRAGNGVEQTRLGFASDIITINKANIEAATSRILDIDVAFESTELAKYTTLTKAGVAMLAQANTSTSYALKLLE